MTNNSDNRTNENKTPAPPAMKPLPEVKKTGKKATKVVLPLLLVVAIVVSTLVVTHVNKQPKPVAASETEDTTAPVTIAVTGQGETVPQDTAEVNSETIEGVTEQPVEPAAEATVQDDSAWQSDTPAPVEETPAVQSSSSGNSSGTSSKPAASKSYPTDKGNFHWAAVAAERGDDVRYVGTGAENYPVFNPDNYRGGCRDGGIWYPTEADNANDTNGVVSVDGHAVPATYKEFRAFLDAEIKKNEDAKKAHAEKVGFWPMPTDAELEELKQWCIKKIKASGLEVCDWITWDNSSWSTLDEVTPTLFPKDGPKPIEVMKETYASTLSPDFIVIDGDYKATGHGYWGAYPLIRYTPQGNIEYTIGFARA